MRLTTITTNQSQSNEIAACQHVDGKWPTLTKTMTLIMKTIVTITIEHQECEHNKPNMIQV
jgi:hypothetical protein